MGSASGNGIVLWGTVNSCVLTLVFKLTRGIPTTSSTKHFTRRSIMTLAEFLIDLGAWLIAFGIVGLAYMVLLWLLMNFMGGSK